MAIERKITSIPRPVIGFLVVLLLAQIINVQLSKESHQQFVHSLQSPLGHDYYSLVFLNSNLLASHLLTLKVQMHDNQAGRHLNYRYLDYKKLSQWLMLLQSLNKQSEYPALLASRVFSHTKDKQQLEQLLKAVIKLYEVNPEKNWRWMAEGAVTAKYHLKDLNLALEMAKKVAQLPATVDIPRWARDIEFILLEELNQYESAIIIIEKSLKDGTDMHNDERRFLNKRLVVLKQKVLRSEQK